MGLEPKVSSISEPELWRCFFPNPFHSTLEVWFCCLTPGKVVIATWAQVAQFLGPQLSLACSAIRAWCHKDYLPAPKKSWLAPIRIHPNQCFRLDELPFPSCSVLSSTGPHSWLHAALAVHPAHPRFVLAPGSLHRVQAGAKSAWSHLLIGVPVSVTSRCLPGNLCFTWDPGLWSQNSSSPCCTSPCCLISFNAAYSRTLGASGKTQLQLLEQRGLYWPGLEKSRSRTCWAVQWFKTLPLLWVSNAGGMSSTPGLGTKIPTCHRSGQKKREKSRNKSSSDFTRSSISLCLSTQLSFLALLCSELTSFSGRLSPCRA